MAFLVLAIREDPRRSHWNLFVLFKVVFFLLDVLPGIFMMIINSIYIIQSRALDLKGCTKLTLWKVKFWKCPTHGYKWSQSHSLWTQRNFVKNQVFKMSTTRLQIRHSWPCCGLTWMSPYGSAMFSWKASFAKHVILLLQLI